MRKTVQKRIWAIVLTLCMMISLMPSALAASAKDFTDVVSAAWYYGAVDYVAEHGYFNGTDVGKFSPDKPMTRGMFVTVLARVDGAEGNDQANPFEDVPSGMWYSGAVAWAAERGIVLGVGDNRFAPERQVSRQEMAAFIARYLTYYMKEHGVTFQATGTAPAFKDADKIADYAVEAVELCRTYGLVYGDEKGCFVPGSLATRAEAATVIQRLALLLETGEEEPSGGGGGGGGGGTSASASSGTAAGFIQAAQKEAGTVTAAVETDNSITVNDDIAISNPSVKTLTLDLNNASLGNLTVNSTSATRIEIKGETASVSSLTINAPRATVTNGVAVNGSVNLQAVSNSTFNNTAPISGNITVTGPAAVNDTQENPAPVVIATENQVIVRGKSETISIQADGAKLTLSTAAAVNPTVSSTAENVTLAVTTGEQTTISGTVKQVTATVPAPKLKVEGTVAVLDAKAASSLSLEGGGLVENLAARNTNIEIPPENTALSIASAELAGGKLTAPDGVVDTVKASGTVELEASVNKAETQPNTTLKLAGEGKTVNTLTAGGTLTMDGQGTVGQIDVTANTSSTVTIPQAVTVSAVNNTGSGQVTLEDKGNAGREATKKAAPPTTVDFAAPTAADGQGTITGVTNAMEYRASGDWNPINSESISVDAGTYQVRVKATDTKLASEAVTVTIPAAVAVKEAAVQGKPYVGQTLTAVANADATGTLAYEWKAGDTVIAGAQGKTFVLTDEQNGKAVTVSISNYEGSEAVTSTPTAAITADKTALKKLLDKATEVQQGVVVEDLSAEKVAKGIVFVTAQEKADLTTAVGHAKKIADNKDALASAVSEQEKALRAAVDTYTAAKKVGTLDEAATLKSALAELINAATGAKVQTTAADAAEVEPGKAWVTEEVKSAYEAAISAAEAAKSGSDPAALAEAITKLNAAMSVYQKAIRKGAALDDTALLAAVNAAELNAASVSISENGKDVLPSQSWVTAADKETYTDAIATAKNTPADKQSVNVKSLTTLNAATETFNGKKEQGTKDIIPPIVTGVSAEKKQEMGNQYTISFTSNEAGTYSYQVGSTEGAWTAGGAVSAASTPVTFSYTPATPGAVLYLQVSDESKNASVVQVKVGEDPETAEASIGSAKYATFEQALKAASSGQTIKLLKDVETEESLTIDKSLTLDTNRQTLKRSGTLAASDTRIFRITEGVTTLTGGGTLTSNDCSTESENSMIRVDKNASLTVGNVTVQTGKNVAYAIGMFGGTVEIHSGAKVTSSYGSHQGIAISTNGSDNWPPATITVTGGVITGGAAGLYLPGKSQQVTISGGEINGGIETKAGTVTITGGTIKASGVTPTSHAVNNNGTSTAGYAVALVENESYQLDGTAVSVNISGGTIKGKVAKEIDSERTGEEVLSITGGAFSEDPSAYVAQDYKAVKNADDTFTVGVKTEPDENDVASVGGRFFTTLQAAVNAAENGDTVTLLKNVTVDEGNNAVRYAGGKTITIEFGGYTLTANTQNAAFVVVNSEASNSTVTLQNGTIIAGPEAYCTVIAGGDESYSATVNVKNMKLQNSRQYGNSIKAFSGSEINVEETSVSSTNGAGGTEAAGGTVNVINCTYNQGGFYDHNSVNVAASNGGTVNVRGGTYTAASYGAYIFNSGGTIHIYEGAFNAGTAVLKADNSTTANKSAIYVEGGSFVGSHSIQNASVLFISGGTFSENPSAYVRDDLTAKKNGDTWIIEKRTAADSDTVASAGGRYFRTLASAVEAAQSSDTIKLLQDTTLPGAAEDYINYDLSGKTLDLGGFKISSINTATAFTGVDAVVQNGSFECLNGGSYALFVGNDGYETDGFLVDNVTTAGGVNIYNASGVTLRNMGVSGTNYYAVWLDQNAFATIESGSYTSQSTETSALLGATKAKDSDIQSELTIEGGTFTAGKDYLSLGNGKITIHSGAFTGPIGHAPPYTEGILSIDGGTFSTDPSAYVPEGYEATESDGSWTVIAKTTA